MKNIMKTYLLIGALSALLIFIGGAIAGQSGIVIALVFSLVFNVVALWFSDRIVLAMYKAEEIQRAHPSGLFEIVERLSRKAGLPMPKVYIIPENAPNAFATGRSPQKAAVAATSGLLHVLSIDEIEAVIAHELSHVKNRDTLIQTLVAVIASAIIHITAIAKWGMIFGMGRGDGDDDRGGLVMTILMIIFAPIAAMLIQAAISRSREYMADKGSKDLIGSGTPLANALRKIDNISSRGLTMGSASQETAHMFIMNPLSGKSLLSMFRTHPETEDRIKELLYS